MVQTIQFFYVRPSASTAKRMTSNESYRYVVKCVDKVSTNDVQCVDKVSSYDANCVVIKASIIWLTFYCGLNLAHPLFG